ncbi:MAG: UDP-N-acetylmuramoyl-L-alanine--D-glutamate ligase [Thermodesulforhabdaceae bacterium]
MQKRKVLVVGLGISGISICDALVGAHHNVTASQEKHDDAYPLIEVTATDSKPLQDLGISKEVLDRLSRAGCRFVLGSNDVGDVRQFQEIIVSPGVPLDIPLLQEARKQGIPIVGELEWAWRRINMPVIAVTGTNGKTTTTELIGVVMHRWGKRTFVGGNIGVPLTQAVMTPNLWDVAVLEVSSFQLDTADTFAPDIFVVLNITEDHLDRYPSFDAYARSKISPILRQQKGQWAIVNGDDETITRLVRENIDCGKIKEDRLIFWSRRNSLAHGFITGDILNVKLPEKYDSPIRISLANERLKGNHNKENMAAAALACMLFGVPPEIIEEAFANFSPGHHRIEWVDRINGVDFYDDSKATNVDAVVRALECFEGRRVWLFLGGRDKGGSYEKLLKKASTICRGICLFGEARPRILEAIKSLKLDSSLEILEGEDLEEAFSAVIKRVRPGEVVLLSPACSSFDQYRSYAERGDHFKQLVKRWKVLNN